MNRNMTMNVDMTRARELVYAQCSLAVWGITVPELFLFDGEKRPAEEVAHRG